MDKSEESVLFDKFKQGDQKAFETLFHRYYGHLCMFASKMIGDDISAEEIVQDFFVKLWEKRDKLFIDTSVKNYLFRSVKNHCINFIRHNKIRMQHAEHFLKENENRNWADDNFVEVDLAKKIEESIMSLPEKRREIFRLSREEGLKYREIAEKLNISIKTVETHMGLAIKELRGKLKRYKSFILFFMLSKYNRLRVN